MRDDLGHGSDGAVWAVGRARRAVGGCARELVGLSAERADAPSLRSGGAGFLFLQREGSVGGGAERRAGLGAGYERAPVGELGERPEGPGPVAGDGYTSEASLADIEGCAECIVAFQNQGGFGVVAHSFPGNVQVKGVVEIQVK